jgi:hypothetical protein
MFARKVSARLKPNSLTEFTNLMECEIVPWLRKQEGFLDLIMLVVPDGREVAAISFWDHRGNAQKYHTSCYPEVLRTLQELLDGKPHVKTFNVVSSTLHKLHTGGPMRSANSVEDSGAVRPAPPQYETHP